MTPIIQGFTKSLQPCSGCGKSVVLQLGVMQKFNVIVQVDAEDAKAAANKVPDNIGKVVSVTLSPQNQVVQNMRPTGPQPSK